LQHTIIVMPGRGSFGSYDYAYDG